MRCFEGTKSKEEISCEKIKFLVVQWMKINPRFKDYPADQYNWKEIVLLDSGCQSDF